MKSTSITEAHANHMKLNEVVRSGTVLAAQNGGRTRPSLVEDKKWK